MTTVLITGGSGWIGSTIYQALKDQYWCHRCYWSHAPENPGPTDHYADIADERAVLSLVSAIKPTLIIHAAGKASADACQQQPDLAFRINTAGTITVAKAAQRINAKLVFTSTDHVFENPGTMRREDEPPWAQTVYGRSKIEAEQAITALDPSALILRLALCYGALRGTPLGFTGYLVDRLARRQPVTVFTDQYRTPLYTGDLAKGMLELLKHNASGIYHFAGPDRLSRQEYSEILCTVFGFDRTLLVPASVRDGNPLIARPTDCSLATAKMYAETGFTFTGVGAGLAALRRELQHD